MGGFVEIQAGCTLPGATPPAGHSDWSDDSLWVPTPGNILLDGVFGARFEGCTFTRLGACAISLEGGSQNNTIAFSEFTDISASAISIGRINTYNISDPARHDAGNVVANCRISAVANEFHGAPGIAVFYTRGTSLVHNEIHNLPYTGISFGWGWGRTMEILWPRMPWDAANDISYNNIHDVMQMLGDGGAIYTLGTQGNVPFPKGPSGKTYPSTPAAPLKVLPFSTIIGNYIHDTGPRDGVPSAPGAGSHSPGGLYTDEGSTNWAMVGNVVVDTPLWLQGCRPGCPWIGHMNISNNWIACDKQPPHSGSGCDVMNVDKACPLVNDQMFTSRSALPAGAQSVIAGAGPRPREEQSIYI